MFFAIAILIGIVGVAAMGFGLASKILPPASVVTEVIEMPNETTSNGQLVSAEELKAAGNALAAKAKDFKSDCVAAENHNRATGRAARCTMEGFSGGVIYSNTGLPEDPASKDAERPMAP